MKSFTLAGPAEIVRAKQKDDNYKDRIQKLWLEILLKSAGTQLWLRLRTIPAGHFLYGGATTLSGLQTLGEEYTGIVQVDSSQTTIPRFPVRLCMVVLDNFGSLILVALLNQLEKVVKRNLKLQPQAKQDVLEAIRILKAILPFLEKCHRALFYCGGIHYQISKRITGIHYVLIRRWLKDYQSLYGFKLLGIVSSLHLLGSALHITWKWLHTSSLLHSNEKDIIPKYSSGQKCPLCLEKRQRVSATPCGHLFCWNCILEWLQSQNQCPICRERVEPSRIIPLQNHL